METLLAFVVPYEASPTVMLCCAAAGMLYWRGRRHVSMWQSVAFGLGLLLIYAALQTRLDYFAQHMFFIHRLQHLLLHHLGPFLIALAAPAAALAAGLPPWVSRRLTSPPRALWWVAPLYRLLQQPLVAAFLFVALIYLWLIPDLHFVAMLNLPLYDTMNWGMAVDGLLFWWMVFNRRAPASSDGRHYGGRILLLFLIMAPQIVIGAHIALSQRELYDVYAVCGRAWPLNALVDQQIGGLITWVPSAMMSIAGALILLQRWVGVRRTEVGEAT